MHVDAEPFTSPFSSQLCYRSGTWSAKLFLSKQETKDFSSRKQPSPRKKRPKDTDNRVSKKVLQADHPIVEFIVISISHTPSLPSAL